MRELTITGCLDVILRRINEDDEYDADAEYEYLSRTLSLTREQALLFAAIMELSVGGDGTPERISRKLGCTNLYFLSLKPDLDELISRRFVRATSGFKGLNYRVPDQAMKCLQMNKVPSCDDITGLTATAILARLNSLFREYYKDNIDRDTLLMEIRDLLKHNPQNSFVEAYNTFGVDRMSDNEGLLLLFMLVRKHTFNEDSWGWEAWSKLLPDYSDEMEIRFALDEEALDIMNAGVVEFVNVDGIADKENLCLTSKATDAFFAEVPHKSAESPVCRNIIRCRDIISKSLFYNNEEDHQVKTLTDLLKQENYTNIVSRLKEKGMRSGFACLFHGTAGTGKTASAYEIARKTGRDIYLVDVSQLKSKWVGDSEKNVQSLFNEYRALVHKSKVAPILLFNEADAIFGLRKKGAENAVDKMENAIQNIILQEMENLDGILIATTNLTQNLDPAFERRFIYKIQFNRPCKEAKTKIWESLVDGMDEDTASILADEYDFSGGQIENISRKMTVDYILHGTTPELAGIRELCANEVIDTKKKPRGRIGY